MKLPKSFTLLELIIFLGIIFLCVSSMVHHYTPVTLDFIVSGEEWYVEGFEWTNGSYFCVVLLLYMNLTKSEK